MNYPLDILMLPIQLIVAWFTVYYTVIAVFGIWHRKDRDLSAPKNKFALMIPAHNEEMVLGDLLENLKILNIRKNFMIFTLLPITVPTVQQKWPIGTALMSLNDVIKNLAGKDMPWIGLFRKYLRQAAIMMRFVCLTQIILFILIFWRS